jgi:hypothetical protein
MLLLPLPCPCHAPLAGMNMRKFVVLALVIGLSGAVLKADPVLSIQPTLSPFESSVASQVTLTFNVLVEQDGEPAELIDPVEVSVIVPGYEDEDTGVAVPPIEGTWHLPAGFSGGQRRLAGAVFGAPPPEPLLAELVLVASSDVTGVQEVPFEIQIHAAYSERQAFVDFCLTPDIGRTGRPWGVGPGPIATTLDLYRDFESVRGIGVIGTPSAEADKLPGLIQFLVTEVVDGNEFPAAAIRVSGAQLHALDTDGNGLAEVVQMTFRLEAPQAVAVAPNAEREFLVYAERTDLGDAPATLLAEVSIKAREEWGNSVFWLDNLDQSIVFERRQSVALGNPRVRLFLNGEALPPDAQATAVIETLHDGNPDVETGLHDLTWDVRVDWEKLQQRVEVTAGDMFRVDMWFPQSAAVAGITRISAVDEVFAPDGLQASTHRDIGELEELEYDNGKTEKDYLDELIEDLKDAGVEIDEDGVSFPPGFPEGEGKDPNWADIREALEKLQEAILDWKNKAREQNGEDILDGKDTFEIDVFIKIDGVLVRFRIVIRNGGRVNDDDKHVDEGSDNEDAPRIVIGVGKCGRDHNGGPAQNGGNAPKVRVRKRGSLGVSVGGNGGNGEADPDGSPDPDAARGANGGNAEVDVDTERDPTTPPPTGIAIGGNGGDSNGEGGSGGDANAEARGGQSRSRDENDGSVAAKGGSTGNSRFPPRGNRPRAGESRVRHDGGIQGGGRRGRASTDGASLDGVSGRMRGGMSSGQHREPADTTEGRLDRSGVTTPGGDD